MHVRFSFANDSRKTSSAFKCGLLWWIGSQKNDLMYSRCKFVISSLSHLRSRHSWLPFSSELVLPFGRGSSVHKPWVSACAWHNFVKWIGESELFILLPHPAVQIKFLLCLWGILPVLSIIDFLALWSACVRVCMSCPSSYAFLKAEARNSYSAHVGKSATVQLQITENIVALLLL